MELERIVKQSGSAVQYPFLEFKIFYKATAVNIPSEQGLAGILCSIDDGILCTCNVYFTLYTPTLNTLFTLNHLFSVKDQPTSTSLVMIWLKFPVLEIYMRLKFLLGNNFNPHS